jgi:hypothetical protein
MKFFNRFKKEGRIQGVIEIDNLPEALIYNICLTMFRVDSATSPQPHNGEPPLKLYEDTRVIKEVEDIRELFPINYSESYAPGFYYPDIAIFCVTEEDDIENPLAQIQHSFGMGKPIEIVKGEVLKLNLKVSWKDVAPEDRQITGVMSPDGKFTAA